MKNKTYGYVRVSSKDQNESRQINAMKDFPVPASQILVDKQSGKDFERPAYKRLLRRVKPGDIIVIHSIDRLGRNYDEILEQWRIITKEKQVDIVVLDFPLLDTRSRTGQKDLTGKFISDLTLQILAYVAQKERESIRQRQAEGIAVAKARNVKFGRSPFPKPDEYEQVYQAWLNKDISARKAGSMLNVSHSTFLKWTKEKV